MSVGSPYKIFTDIDGQPLDDGYVFIGTAGLNPQTNPITVFSDPAFTLAVVQPIRTNGGYPVLAGTPARLYTPGDYSITVLNKNGTLVFTSLQNNANDGPLISTVSTATGTGSQVAFTVLGVPFAVYINGVYQNKNTYSVTGTTLTFTQAPPLTSIIEFMY
jgi:hypothetical protein